MNPYAVLPDPNSFVTCPGDEFHIVYSSVLNEDGTIELVPTAKDSIQEHINSFASQTDMHFILAQLKNGNTSVINRAPMMFGDFTDVPKSYAHALQMVIDGRAAFEALPLDVRNKFDNSFEKWFATAGSSDWISAMSFVNSNSSIEDSSGSSGESEVINDS